MLDNFNRLPVRNTWRRDLLTDIKRTGYSWRELEKKAQDRRLWKTVTNDLIVMGVTRSRFINR